MTTVLEFLESWFMIMLTALGCVILTGALIVAIIIIIAAAASVIKTIANESNSDRR